MSLLMDALRKAEEAKKTYQPADTTANRSNNSHLTEWDDSLFFPERQDPQAHSQRLPVSDDPTKELNNESLVCHTEAIMVSESSQVLGPQETTALSSSETAEWTPPAWQRDFLKELNDENILPLNADEAPKVSLKDLENTLRSEFKDSDSKETVIPYYEESTVKQTNTSQSVEEKPVDETAPQLDKVAEATSLLNNASDTATQTRAFALREWQQEQMSHPREEVTTVAEDNPFGPSPLELGFHTATRTANNPDEGATVTKKFTEHTSAPEPTAAQRILAASAPPSSPRTKLIYALLMVVIISMGIGTYYYYDLSKSSQFLASQPSQTNSLFKKPPATESTRPAVDKPGKIVHEETTAPVVKSAPKPLDPPPVSPAQPAEPPAPVAPSTASLPKETALIEPSKLVVPPNSDNPPQPPKETSNKSNPAPAKPDTAVTKTADNDKSTVKSPKENEIQLRKTLNQQMNTEIANAYSAFHRGDKQTAERAYSHVLQQDQNHRDALLGLAAIAMQKGDTYTAQQYYRRVLKLYPQDTYAKVSLINLLDNRSQNSESQLKLLLDKSPQSAYIHFSLGNLYANQGRWVQAQQAYFDAYRYDNNKADYAYNLAISLDQLNQPAAALNYYQQALHLARTQAVSFNSQAISRRVRTLQNYTQTKALSTLPTQPYSATHQ